MENYISNYIATLPADQAKALTRVRDIVRKTAPTAIECESYKMPTFKYKSRNLIHFAAFKDHCSIFPTSIPAEALKERLQEFSTAKGTIRFTPGHEVPEDIVKALVQIRMDAIDSKR